MDRPMRNPVQLDKVVNLDALIAAQTAGNVRVQSHPASDCNYKIANYSESCVFDRAWDEVTLTCRGLIWDADTGEVKARPFRKFFNHNEVMAPKVPLNRRVAVSDKLDGSLGIWYRNYLGMPSVATRGSFTSPQAIAASLMLDDLYDGWEPWSENFTPLFEIIYPENRIVVDYGGASGLYLLGAVDIATGVEFGPRMSADLLEWPGPVAETWEGLTYRDALEMEPRPGKEGIVVDAGITKVKIKQEDYVAMHKLVTGLSKRAVWDSLDPGNPADSLMTQLEDFAAQLPDEFHQWTKDVGEELMDRWDAIMSEINLGHYYVREELGEEYTRKDFALHIKDDPLKPYLFMLEDGKDFIVDVGRKVWNTIKPAGDTRMFNGGSDDE